MNEEQNKNTISPIAAGITGLLLGVFGTAAVVLSDKDTRKKAQTKAHEMKNNLKKWSQDTLHDIHESGKDVKKDAESKVNQATKKTEQVSKETANKVKETIGPKIEEL